MTNIVNQKSKENFFLKSGETENQEFAINLSNIGILYDDKSPAYA